MFRNTAENISPKRAIDAFRDNLIRRDFRETLGRAKPKKIDHLMSLANEWADGEYSIMNPRNRHRSSGEGNDVKEHFSGAYRVRQKDRQSHYTDIDPADM
jgi:hypothetical protein